MLLLRLVPRFYEKNNCKCMLSSAVTFVLTSYTLDLTFEVSKSAL